MKREPLARDTGINIGNLLRDAKISQEQVANTFGLSQQAVSRRVTGEVEFSAHQLRVLSRMLDTPVDALLTLTAPSPDASPAIPGEAATSVGGQS